MMVKVLLIEDEPSAQKHLINLLKGQNITIEVLACLCTVKDSIDYLKINPVPDLIFMDIQLSDGLSFNIMDDTEIDCPIIFTTAYDEYAIQAFKTSGIAYLLKPITREDMGIALEKYNRFNPHSSADWVLKSLDALAHYRQKHQATFKKRFLLKSGNSVILVPTDEISYFFREEIVFAKTTDNKIYPVDRSLNQLQSQLNPNQFVRLNRRVLVQVDAIVELRKYKPGQFTVQLVPEYHELLQISQERSSWLRDFLDKDY